MKTLEQVKSEVDLDRFYRPREIANNRWMIEYQGNDSYYYILKLIKVGRLKARNFGLGKTNFWKVTGREIIKYLELII